MSDQQHAVEWRERANVAIRAAVVVACYLVVFAGLLLSVAGAGQ